MKRLNRRVHAAIARASRRFFESLYFVAPNGKRLSIEAVKKSVDDSASPEPGASYVTRRVEFVVSRETFDQMRALSGSSLDFKTIRGASLVEKGTSGSIVYQFDQSFPYSENSQAGLTVSLYVHRK